MKGSGCMKLLKNRKNYWCALCASENFEKKSEDCYECVECGRVVSSEGLEER